MEFSRNLSASRLLLWVFSLNGIQFFHSAMANNVLNFLERNIYMYNGTPKHWHAYIRTHSHVHFLLFNVNKTSQFLPDMFLMQLKSCRLFMTLSVGDICKPNSNFTTEVVKVSGYLSESAKARLWHTIATFFKTTYEWGTFIQFEMIWKFHIDRRVSLNLTFEHIHFTVDFQACPVQHVKVFNNLTENNYFMFCGQHARFSLYPPHHRLNVGIFVNGNFQFAVKCFYVIVDSNVIVNLPLNTNSTQTDFIAIFKVQDTKSYLLHVGVSKNAVIVMQVRQYENSEHVVFDGPGYLSRILSTSNMQYKTNTFQCTILIFVATAQFNSWFNYSSQSALVHKEILLQDMVPVVINLPFPKCPAGLCAVFVIGKPHMQVNFTVQRIRYQGLKTQKCKHGGIAAVEKLGEVNKEVASLCETHDGNASPNREIYSANSSLLILVYWYEHYSNISVTLIVKHSACTSVTIQPCLLQQICSHSWKNCKTHTSEILGNSPFELKFSKPNRYSFSTEIGHCIVLQFAPPIEDVNAKKSHHISCDVLFRPASDNAPDLLFGYQMKLSMSKEEEMFLGDPENTIAFHNVDHEFCSKVLSVGNSNSKCFKPQRATHGKWVATLSNGDFFLATNASKSATEGDLYFVVQLHRWSRSWINAIVSATRAVEPLSHSSLLVVRSTDKQYVENPKSSDFQLLLLAFKPQRDTKQAVEMHMRVNSNVTEHLQKDLQIAYSTYPLSRIFADMIIVRSNVVWTSCIVLMNVSRHQLIRVQGEVNFAEVTFSSQRNTSGFLRTVWMKERKEIQFKVLQHNSPCSLSTQTNITFQYCSNVTEMHFIDKLHLIFVRQRFFPFFPYHKVVDKRISWNQAAKFCRSFNANLVTFENRGLLKMFVALLSISTHIPPLEAVYIGLNLQHAQVQHCIYILQPLCNCTPE